MPNLTRHPPTTYTPYNDPQIQEWAKSGGNNKLCTARPGWQTMSLRVGKCTSTPRSMMVAWRWTRVSVFVP